MGTQTTFMLNTHFKLVNKTLVYDFLYKNMFLFLSSIWVFITTYTLYLLNFLSRNLFRFHVGDTIEKEELKLNSPAFILLQEVKQVESNCLEPEPEPEPEPDPEPEVVEYEDKEYNGFVEEDVEKETATGTLSSFSFKFQSYEDTRRSNGGFEDYAVPEKAFVMNTNTSKYQFLPGKDFNGFIEEPQAVSFSVKHLYVDLNDKLESPGNHKFSSEERFLQSNLEIGDMVEELVTHSVEYPEKPESLVLTDVQLPEKDKLVSVESSLSSSSKEEISDGVQSVLKKEFSGFDSEPESESTSFGEELSVRNHAIESNSEEFSSDKNFEEGTDIDNMIDFDEVKLKAMEDIHSFEETHFDNSNDMDKGVTDTSEQSSFVQNRSVANVSPDMEVKIELIEEIESILETEFLNESEVGENKNEQELEQCNGEREELMDYSVKSQEPSLQEDSSLSGSEDSNGLEIWEHQDLIEQLKMELKKVRATGLPTILEESESPKVVDDLKPWKIEEKFLHEDRIDELHKFYKIYRERMRKFDILNYQKMYAIGFLQLKDPLQTMSCKKSGTPTLTSVLSQNFGLSKRKSTEDDTSAKFMTELQNDLEMIYVGQLSLSWEFLHWQYQKARELLDSDPYETRRYNQVAGEFQQFQVLMQRFMENELFQGPRVQNYIKNRCILRNLLQVPVIKEDSRDKEGRQRSKDAITCSLLLMVIEESMRIFWEFLRADKNAGIVMFKSFLGAQVELHNPSDSELLLEVQTTLQKKDRKLKELMRIGNCIVRRFQKNHRHQDGGGRSNQVILYSQVDLKLVSRVLNMSRITTDQLVWCRKKLDKITLVDRKIHIEPSFLPFPC